MDVRPQLLWTNKSLEYEEKDSRKKGHLRKTRTCGQTDQRKPFPYSELANSWAEQDLGPEILQKRGESRNNKNNCGQTLESGQVQEEESKMCD